MEEKCFAFFNINSAFCVLHLQGPASSTVRQTYTDLREDWYPSTASGLIHRIRQAALDGCGVMKNPYVILNFFNLKIQKKYKFSFKKSDFCKYQKRVLHFFT